MLPKTGKKSNRRKVFRDRKLESRGKLTGYEQEEICSGENKILIS